MNIYTIIVSVIIGVAIPFFAFGVHKYIIDMRRPLAEIERRMIEAKEEHQYMNKMLKETRREDYTLYMRYKAKRDKAFKELCHIEAIYELKVKRGDT